VLADRIARLLGAKISVALGFLLVMAGMLVGGFTTTSSSEGFIATWVALVGLGLGLTLATAATGALAELSPERAGVGSAVMQALQKTGAPFGVAVLGSVLSTAYQAQLNLAGLPPAVAQIVKQSLFGGLAVAQHLRSAALLASVRSAFVFGMDRSLFAAAGIAAAGVILTIVFLPRRARTAGGPARAATASTPAAATAQEPGAVVPGAATE
jgi:MFS family permease